MAEYHVEHDPVTGLIYAGKKRNKKWAKKFEATEEVLAAARDHLMYIRDLQDDKPPSIGYQWKDQDGKTIILQLIIHENNND